MSEDVTILYCPKCRNRYREAKTVFDITKPLTCSACRASFGVDELVTASGETLPEHVATVIDQFPMMRGILRCPTIAIDGHAVEGLAYEAAGRSTA